MGTATPCRPNEVSTYWGSLYEMPAMEPAYLHECLADNDDSTYLTTNSSGAIIEQLPAPSDVPAGAVIKEFRVRLRVNGWNGASIRNIIVDIAGVGVWQFPDSYPYFVYAYTWEVGRATVNASGAATIRTDLYTDVNGQGSIQPGLFEEYLDWVYVAKPVVTVTAPVSPPNITDNNLATATWAPDLDPDGGAQTAWEVKVFNDSTAGWPNINADTATPYAQSGIQTGNQTSWTGSTYLPDDNYRSYVRVAQTVNGNYHWSDWAYSGFTVLVDRPAVPTITATASNSAARIALAVTSQSGAETTTYMEVQRSSDSGATWEWVRTTELEGRMSSSGTVWDYESGNGVSVIYRARAVHLDANGIAYSAWSSSTSPTSWSSTEKAWLKHPFYPARNILVTLVSYSNRTTEARASVLQPLGAAKAVALWDLRGTPTGEIKLVALTEQERDDLEELLSDGSPLLLQVPGQAEPDRWLAIGNAVRERVVDKSYQDEAYATLAWSEIDRPIGPIAAWS